jgi:hypothetical protein
MNFSNFLLEPLGELEMPKIPPPHQQTPLTYHPGTLPMKSHQLGGVMKFPQRISLKKMLLLI